MSRRILQGVVVSDAADKTIVVRVERRVMHPIYKKFITHSKKYAAHDEHNRWHVGDMVRIEESRPVSKRKHWVALGGLEERSGSQGAVAADAAAQAVETAAGAA
jgi:small subunit ribosomal protein S17